MPSNIVVIGQSSCLFCIKAKQFLDEHGFTYQYLTIGKDIRKEQVLEQYPSATTVPIVVIDGQWIGGYDELVEAKTK